MATDLRHAILYGDVIPTPVAAGDPVPKAYADALVAGLGLGDGTYGDIVVSSSGTVFTVGSSKITNGKIAAKAVTYSKIQDATGSNVVLGRATAGAGQYEEVPCTAVGRAVMAAATAGDQRTVLGLAIGTDVQAYRQILGRIYYRGADIAAAATVTLSASLGDYILITGTGGPITSFGTGATSGWEYTLRFASAGVVITHSSNLALFGSADITTEADDVMVVRAGITDGQWRCVDYRRQSGQPLFNNPQLAAIGGLTSAANKGIQFTGSGTAATYDLTAAGKALLDDANAAAQRVTLGLSDGALEIVIDGGGAAIATGIKLDVVAPWACTITGWTLLADQSGDIVLNIWKDTYANFPPTVADKITASLPPTLSAADKGQSTTLTGWTTAIAKGDILRFNVDSAATVERVTLSLAVTR